MKLHKLICETAQHVFDKQAFDGSFPPGNNGPYKDLETSVRNTAHWCITFLKVYEITKEQKYFDSALRCGEYLLSEAARPMDSVFFCRKNPEKDFANGLVGQAWAIEALVKLTEVTGDQKYRELAERVFMMHPYDEKYKAWIRLNVDGSYSGFDGTFNHQLWFAAAGAMLMVPQEEIHKQVKSFMDALEDHFEIYNDGCIRHKGMFLKKSPQEIVKGVLQKVLEKPSSKKYMRMKSVGYHGFNLYAFGILKKQIPEHSFWKSKKFLKALKFAASDLFKKELPKSKYGFPYNPPGFEMAYAFQEFDYLPDDEIAKWVSWQFKTCYNFEINLMTEGGTYDKETAAARFYEATRLKNYKLNI